jgi:hypothetical protein
MQTTADGQLVQLGRSFIPLSTDPRLQRLTPDNEHMGSVQRLREALDKKGYLYLKQLQPRDKVIGFLPISNPSLLERHQVFRYSCVCLIALCTCVMETVVFLMAQGRDPLCGSSSQSTAALSCLFVFQSLRAPLLVVHLLCGPCTWTVNDNSRPKTFYAPGLDYLIDGIVLSYPSTSISQLCRPHTLILGFPRFPSQVLEAGRRVLEHLHNMGTVFDPKHPWESGVLAANCGIHCLPFMEGRNDITHSDAVLRVLEGQEIRSFFDAFFGEPSLTFDFKWLRAVHRQAFTGAHTDSVYMSRGSKVRVGWLISPPGFVTKTFTVQTLSQNRRYRTCSRAGRRC